MKSMHIWRRYIAAALSIGVLCASMVCPSAANAPSLKLSKTEFVQGERVTADYTGASGKDWIAIYKDGDKPGGPESIVYEYTSKTGQPDGTMDFKETDRGDVTTLAAGNYDMYLLKNDGYDILAKASFVIKKAGPAISVDKPVYPKGETPVFTYAGSTHNDAWIGIYPADKKTPSSDNPSLIYKYTREVSQPNGSTDLKQADGTTKIDELPAGEYYAYLFEDGGYTIAATCTFTLTDKESLPSISTDKAAYEVGQAPVFSYTGSTHNDAWIGIYPAANKTPGDGNLSLVYKYTRDIGQPNGSTDLKQADGTTKIDELPAGEYYVYLFEDGGYTIAATCTFTLTEKQAGPSISTDKESYVAGELPVFSYTGSTHNDAWIGIYPAANKTPGAPNPSLVYKYTREVGQPNGSTDLKVADGTTKIDKLPVGEYYAYLFADGGYTIVATCTFTLKDRDPNQCYAPKAVEYTRTAQKQGYADGSVSITPADNTEGLTGYRLYWGNDSGVLKEYSEIPVKAAKGNTTHKLNANTMIPYGATRLYAFAVYDDKTQSPDSVYTELDKGIAAVEQKPLYSFQAFSDTHITNDPNHLHSKHLKMALADIAKNDPDSIAIFNSGDVADSGEVSQYRQYNNIVNSFDNIPFIYCTPGNHDLKGSNYNKEINDFLKGTNAPSTYYSKKIGDATFIMLGSQIVEPADCHAQLNKDQLDFLKAELQKASDGMKPVFVFLHQPLYNTVSGTLPGQNWHGVYQDKELRAIFKQYPQTIFITGHTHWELDSKSPMFAGNGIDATMFNDASVGYLWTDEQTGKEGSQGYYVEVYSDHVLVRGRDFVNGKWVSNAQFIVDLTKNVKGLTAQIAENDEGLIAQADQIDALLRDIDAMTGDQANEYQAEKAKLQPLAARAKALKSQAEALKGAIEALPGAGKVTLDHKPAVEKAVQELKALTEEQKALIGNELTAKLSGLVSAIEELEKGESSTPVTPPVESEDDNSSKNDPSTDSSKQEPPADSSAPEPSDNNSSDSVVPGDDQSKPGSGNSSKDNPQTSAPALWGLSALLLASAGGCLVYSKKRRK